MVKITTKRGTAVEDVSGDIGRFTPEAKDEKRKRIQLSGPNTNLVTHRGTAVAKAKDMEIADQPSLKGQKITTKRGTSTDTL
mgnify:FL=1|jgi:hypothetical protein